ncbi:MAG: HlyD family type I secretion periplasmic adaptor subunit [Candidatus Competibacteraceae bacterium]|nr:HlyD family type I secretion periplasmic adaptor subunit [Candidatus Competibacteraceae bacterium]
MAALAFTLLWASLGEIDTVATAAGQIISSTRGQTIQPLETAAVRRIAVVEGQPVEAGQLLVELDATSAGAESAQAKELWVAESLRAARAGALLDAIRRGGKAALPAVAGAAPNAGGPRTRSSTASFRNTRPACGSSTPRSPARRPNKPRRARWPTSWSSRCPSWPSARKTIKSWSNRNTRPPTATSKEQARVEMEQDLAYQKAKVAELGQAAAHAKSQRVAWAAEYLRGVTAELADAEHKSAHHRAELDKAENKNRLTRLTAPVAGTVQQLAVHTEGGVVTPAQVLMVIAPRAYTAEVEAVLENKDVGFVKDHQPAEIKVETFPYTCYGTVPATVTFVSNDAVSDDRRGLIFPARLTLKHNTLRVDERTVNLTPGMAVTAEIKTGKRRILEYFLSPVLQTIDESLTER